ncbi:MAG: hypothetical protein P8N51_03595 [Pseudomonadales bacterium]|nr:hypothetical protein [Pseudomonadales bacterium]
MMRVLSLFLTLALITSPALADKNQKKRDKINSSAASVLTKLYEQQPATKKEIAGAVGYAVF